ncbi:MAG: homoserine O-acetyltransferase [Negativicutes bacterium]|nr:homoserine O-acetyltransferase [Negativicutes bacterium]
MKTAIVADARNPLLLASGAQLNEVVVAYETYGNLSAARDNVILVLHALTGDSHPAAHDAGDEVGWWEPLVGPGRPIDTDVFYVVCANVLGGCQGTTGPASPDPATGKPYGMRFPQITIRDMVHVQKRLLDRLGIDHVVLVIGGSMGGAQALEWAVTYPDFMDGAVVIAAPGFTAAQAIAYNKVGRDAIMLDPAWNGGDYYGTPGPVRGLAIARSLGMITYQSEASMEEKFGRRVRQGNFEIENYLHYQGESLVKRFDANSYLYLLRALDLHNVGNGYPSYEAALARVKAEVLVVGVSSDILYPSSQQRQLTAALRSAGARAEYREIDSPHGHDGFLIDFHLLRPIVDDFINRVAKPKELRRMHSLFRPSELAYLGARLITEI